MIMAIYEFGARELLYEPYIAHNSFDCRLSPVVKIRRWQEAQIKILVNGFRDPLITLERLGSL